MEKNLYQNEDGGPNHCRWPYLFAKQDPAPPREETLLYFFLQSAWNEYETEFLYA